MKYTLKTFDNPVEVTGIANLHYFEFTNKYRTVDDFHDFCELLYIDKGSVMVHAENYEGSLSDNQLIVHRPNEVHSLECDENTALNVIIIGFACSCEALATVSRCPVTLSPEQKKMLSEVMQEGMMVFAPPYDLPNTKEMNKRAEIPFAAEQMLKNRLEAFLISLIREHPRQASFADDGEIFGRISDIKQYIHEHFTEKILLDQICFLFSTNKTTLCKEFKNTYGTTVLNYINYLRLKEAKRLLRENKLSVTEISERLGFNSIHYFCRLFKKNTGHSPKEYMKTIRSKLDL